VTDTFGCLKAALAEDLRHERKVAVKVLLPELAAVPGAERFLREIEIAAGLTHPHILPLHDSGQADVVRRIPWTTCGARDYSCRE
jgi:serine/threonine-protein kinase